jgi:hypothetical protein
MDNVTDVQTDGKMISNCGFYCGACPKFTKGQCKGCKGDAQECAVGYKQCKVRPCCIENEYSTCADCKKFASVKECRIYNPFMIRFGQFITGTNRRKGIEMIKQNGEEEFVKFMIGKNWVTVKTGKY